MADFALDALLGQISNSMRKASIETKKPLDLMTIHLQHFHLIEIIRPTVNMALTSYLVNQRIFDE